MNPPLTHPSPICGFSMNSTTRSPSTRRRPDGRHRGQPAVGAVKLEQRGQVHVADPVPVGQQERTVVEPTRQSLDAATGPRLDPRVDKVDEPVLGPLPGRDDVPRGQVHGEGVVQHPVFEKEALDHVALVAQRDDELPETVPGIVLHDVPEDGPAPDLHHRLRPQVGLLRKPAPEASCQDDHLHRVLLLTNQRSVGVPGSRESG
jgi:hypothetical protein